MKFSSLLTFYFVLLASFSLCSCHDRKPAIDTFGELDSLKIAADTTMQLNMDRSYEYQKTLKQNDTTVFDFLAYDKPKGSSSPDWESKFIVIRRTTSAYDTIIKEVRAGIVMNLWLSDMNSNGNAEIMFYEYPKRDAKPPLQVKLYAYETDGRKQANKISGIMKDNAPHYRGQDSFFVSDGYLIRRTPYYDKAQDSVSSGAVWQSYGLSGGKFIFEKQKTVLQ